MQMRSVKYVSAYRAHAHSDGIATLHSPHSRAGQYWLVSVPLENGPSSVSRTWDTLLDRTSRQALPLSQTYRVSARCICETQDILLERTVPRVGCSAGDNRREKLVLCPSRAHFLSTICCLLGSRSGGVIALGFV